MNDAELRRGLRRTLAYAQIFQAPLSWPQLVSYFLSAQQFSAPEIAHILRPSLPSLPDSTVYVDRQTAQELQEFQRHLRWVPWIQSVWLTGSRAVSGQSHDDIDFLIICDPHRLWLTRLVVVGWANLFGKARRWWQSHQAAPLLWCFNFWLEPTEEHFPHQLYQARELMQAYPVWIRSDISPNRLLYKNSWVQDFSANGWKYALGRNRSIIPQPPVWWTTVWRWRVLDGWWQWLNGFLYRVQLRYMGERQHQSAVTFHSARFYPLKRSDRVQAQYEKIGKL